MSHSPSGDMLRPTNVASGSSSRLATLKSLVPPAQRDAVRAFFDRRVTAEGTSGIAEERKQSWKEWAGDKIRKRGTGSGSKDAVERISLFPGWAHRRYHGEKSKMQGAAEFELDIYVSGFAASYIPPELATRSQRAFMRLAKAYAALPKLPTTDPETAAKSLSSQHLSRSTEDLLKTVHLPPRPSEITEESELEALETQFARAEHDVEAETSSLSSYSPAEATPKSSPPISENNAAPPALSPLVGMPQFSWSSTDLATLHANLTARLQPFWSRSLSNRRLRLSVYGVPPPSNFLPEDSSDDPARVPIYTQEVVTSQQGGAFEVQLSVPWEKICVHPGALQIAFGDYDEEYELFVSAEFVSPNPMGSSDSGSSSSSSSESFQAPISQFTQGATTRTVITVPVTHSEVRLISDIDDTIKLSNIVGGARAVFRNVFVRRLDELVIKGMGEWYTNLWTRGVRFHYVSNGPFELLPVINEFIKVSNLPRGSIKLRSYAGRSLFNGLLSAPATRKRDGILNILRAFRNARFFLVGDSGEQDMELYAQLASEWHTQILAVFIRDASGPDGLPLEDPTGEMIKRQPPVSRKSSYAASTAQTLPDPMELQMGDPRTPTQGSYSTMGGQNTLRASSPSPLSAAPSRPPGVYLPNRTASQPTRASEIPYNFPDPAPSYTSTQSTPTQTDAEFYFPGSIAKADLANLPLPERRRIELQERVYRARLLMPSRIPLRVFKEPEECVEAERILSELDHIQRPDHS